MQEDAIEKLADYRVLPDCLGRFDANYRSRAFTYRILRFSRCPLLGLANEAYGRVDFIPQILAIENKEYTLKT